MNRFRLLFATVFALFVKAVWSIWFGRIDQPAMGDQLISLL